MKITRELSPFISIQVITREIDGENLIDVTILIECNTKQGV
jgi:hypothetical protein